MHFMPSHDLRSWVGTHGRVYTIRNALSSRHRQKSIASILRCKDDSIPLIYVNFNDINPPYFRHPTKSAAARFPIWYCPPPLWEVVRVSTELRRMHDCAFEILQGCPHSSNSLWDFNFQEGVEVCMMPCKCTHNFPSGQITAWGRICKFSYIVYPIW